MSMLISSAAAGAKAPPKAPPRRRPPGPSSAAPPSKPAPKPAVAAPVPDAASVETSTSTASAQEPSSRPSTATQQVRFADTVTSIAPSRVTAELTTVPAPSPRRVHPPTVLADDAVHHAVAQTPAPVHAQQQTPAPTQQEPSEGAAPTEILQSPAPTAVMVSSAEEEIARPNKRTRESDGVAEKPRKAPKRSSTRSNAAVQAHVEGVGELEPARPSSAENAAARLRTRDSDEQEVDTVSVVEPQAVPVEGGEELSAAERTSAKGKASKKPAKPRAKKAAKSAATVREDDSGGGDRTARIEAAVPVLDGLETAAGDTTEALAAVTVKSKARRAPSTKPAKKRTRRTRTASEELADNVAAEEAAGADEESASDPELHEIDPNTLSMFQLTRQKRYGKTSKREQEMQAIDWDEVARKRREAAEVPIATAKEKKESEAKARAKTVKRTKKSKSQTPANGIAETIEGDTVEGANVDDIEDEAEDDNDEAPDNLPTETRATNTTVGFRIVNGEIVMDEDTLTLDRHALATAQIASDLHIADEASDLTLRINNATHMNDRKRFPADRVPVWKAKSDPWSDEETDRFYEALRCWGTDFGIIAKLFPGKTRAMVKKKFGREERIEPERIDAALLGRATPPPPSLTPGPATASVTPAPAPAERASMSLPLFAHQSEIPLSDLEKFPSLAEAEEAIKLSLKDKEEAMQVLLAEEAEDERQRAVMEETRKRVQEERERRKANGGNGKGRGRRVGREVGFGGG
ncbi:hypothetical protein B0A48_09498 [Cryoendolithus antarcticus]|uniref:Myb-like domain-containing protein n=1 Tax=Cryoendolithus antarcticus TaxID=1507870 RepID=A0A1V8SZH7_9PEZI|nr:hypothetical protein B0A48_09498 [Cryoendolithus antarcticus]